MGEEYPLNISTIILQSSCSNLESFIKPLTILDNILSNNVYRSNIISDNDKNVSILSCLFSSCLSKQQYVGNQYIWNIFNSFINHKQEIKIHIDQLDEYCENKQLLQLILSEIVKQEEYKEEYCSDKYKNKNLLKPQILSIFKNVTYLYIDCDSYPLSLESLLSLINNTQIKKVEINGEYWLRKVKEMSSFNNILSKYKVANFNMEFDEDDEEFGTYDEVLTITCNK